MARGTWITKRRRTIGFGAVWMLMGLVFVVLAAGLAALPTLDEHRVRAAILFFVGTALPGLAMVRYGWGCTRAGMRIDRDGVLIVNPLSRRTVPLADVRAFRAGLHEHVVGNPSPGVVLERLDGTTLDVWALGSETWVWRTERGRARWTATADQLTGLVATLR